MADKFFGRRHSLAPPRIRPACFMPSGSQAGGASTRWLGCRLRNGESCSEARLHFEETMFDVAVFGDVGGGGVFQFGGDQAIDGLASGKIRIVMTAELAFASHTKILLLRFAMDEVHGGSILRGVSDQARWCFAERVFITCRPGTREERALESRFGKFETKFVQTGDGAAGVEVHGICRALFHNFC